MTAGTPNLATMLLPIVEQGDWVDQAVCAQVDGELFYPEKGGTPAPAKAICRDCRVSAECLKYALDNNEQFGVWGGFTAEERRVMVSGRKRCRLCRNRFKASGSQLYCSDACAARAQQRRAS